MGVGWGSEMGKSRLFLMRYEGWSVSRGGLEGWLRRVPAPPVVVCAAGRGSTLLLLQALQKWQLNFWSLCIFRVQNLPPGVHACSYF